MSNIRKVISTLKAAIGTPKNHRSSLDRASTTTSQQQEYLDTSGMVKILVIGETGCGKSTFINYLTNYFRQGSLKNIKVAIPSKHHPCATEDFAHCEHDIQNTSQSKTNACNQYMFASNGRQYLFLDTPGLSDTRGAEQDDKNIVKIVDSVESLGGITTVIIVVNGAVSRLTVNLRNAIARLRGNLPDIIMSNVILLLTNSNRYAANFDLQVLGLNGNIYPYYMQNSAFSTNSSTWTPCDLEALQFDWDLAMDEIEAMLKTVNAFKMKSVTAFKQMKDIRNEIKAQMHTIRVEISKIQKMQDEIENFEIVLRQSDKDLLTYKDYSKELEVEKVEIVDAPFYSTLCRNCNHVCHPNCQLDETTIVGAQIFQSCWAMSNGNCLQCSHKCSYTSHYHARKTVLISKQKLYDVVAEIKAKYDQASQNKSDYQNKITYTEDAKKLLENALLQKNEEIKQLCLQLREICSGFNIAEELHALIDQLEIEAAILQNIEIKHQANAIIRSLKEFCSMIEKEPVLSQKTLSKMNIMNTERPVPSQTHRPNTSSTNSTILVQQQRENLNTFSESHSHFNSHANHAVLQAIRAAKKKKAKVSSCKKPTSEGESDVDDREDEENTENNSMTSQESHEEENDKKKKKHQQQTKKKTASNNLTSTTIDANQFKMLTIDELLARYHACTEQRMSNFIVYEMMQRANGKSLGPFNSAERVVELTASSQKYCALQGYELREEYERLKSLISEITEPDILKIDQVPQTLLLDIAAVYILIQRTPSENRPPTPTPQLLTPSAPPRPPRAPKHRSYNYNSQSSPLTSIPKNHTEPPSYIQNHQLSSPKLPQLSSVYNPYFHQPPHSVSSSQQSQRHVYSNEEQQNLSTTMSEPPLQDYENLPLDYFSHRHYQERTPECIHGDIVVQTHAFSSNLPRKIDNTHPSEDRYDYGMPINDHCLSLITNDAGPLLPSSSDITLWGNIDKTGSNEKIRTMSNARLLAAYKDAHDKQSHEKSNILYNELKSRCYGDHPLLLNEKRSVFEAISKKYQDQSLAELIQLQSQVLKRIQDCLVDNDATRINNIPSELIIEANVLAHLVAINSCQSNSASSK